MNAAADCCVSAKIRKTGKHGFTLTELALVLGIVGILFAGIFITAGIAERRLNVDQASDELQLIVGNMRQLYSSQATAGLPASSFGTLTPILITQGVFPSEMLSPHPAPNVIPCLGTIANNPWGSFVGGCPPSLGAPLIGSVQLQIDAGAPTLLEILYTNLPQEVCMDLLPLTTLPDVSTGVRQVKIINSGGGSVTYTTSSGAGGATQLPVSPSNSAIGCTGGQPYQIDWYYALGG